jgi:uncharacterized protein
MPVLRPNRYFKRITRIDIARDIKGCGYTHILLDIDNTILTRDTHLIPDDVALWLDSARSAGLTICLLSNNWHHGVYELADRLDLPLVAKAIKPLPFAYFAALRKLGAKRKTTLAIGDQLITDVWGAHFVGICAYMLDPLVEKDLWHTLLLRHLQNVIMRNQKPES